MDLSKIKDPLVSRIHKTFDFHWPLFDSFLIDCNDDTPGFMLAIDHMTKLKYILPGILLVLLTAFTWQSLRTPPQLRLANRQQHSYLFRNIGLLSMTKEDGPVIQQNKLVLIKNGRIKSIALQDQMALLKNEELVEIDGKGAILMPGLIDAHVHVWDEPELAGYLTHGVTGIRNMSGMPIHLDWIRRIKNKKLLAPDFKTTSPILNSPGPNQQINHLLLEDAETARAKVRSLYKKGYRLIKLYSNLYKEVYEAILDEAAKKKIGITGHTPEGRREKGIPYGKDFQIPFSYSLDKNFQSIEHIESIVWHGLRDQLDTNKMQEVSKQIAASQTSVTTTLIAHTNLVRVARTKGEYLNRSGTDTINPLLKIAEKETYQYWSTMNPIPREIPRADFYLESAEILHRNGVKLLAGSDAGIFTNIPGSALTRELELLVKSGIPSYDVLKMATVNPAEALGFKRTGQVSPGQIANLILVKENPLENISTVENPLGVMIRGHWLDQSALKELKSTAKNTSLIRSLRYFLTSLIL
jgi:hypothetical protein